LTLSIAFSIAFMKCGEKLHTFGKRAAISFTATCILSAQGIKLLEEKMIDTVLKSQNKNHQSLESETSS